MPTLPDSRALGPRPIPQSRRPIRDVPGADLAARAAIQSARSDQAAQQDLFQLGVRGLSAADELQRRRDRSEIARARSIFLAKKVELDHAFDRDHDYETFGKRYHDGIDKIRQEAAELVSSPNARGVFVDSVADDAARGLADIGKLAWSKEKDFGKAGVLEALDANLNASLAAKNDVDRVSIFEATQAELSSAVGRGYLTQVEGVTQSRKFAEDYGTRFLETLSPEAQLKALGPDPKSKTGSFVDFIPSDKRRAYYEKAQTNALTLYERRIRIADREAQRASDDLERRFALAGSHEDKEAALEEAESFRLVDPKALKRMRDGLESYGTGIKTDPFVKRFVFEQIRRGDVVSIDQLSAAAGSLGDTDYDDAQKLIVAMRDDNFVANTPRFRAAVQLLKSSLGVPEAGFTIMDTQARIAMDAFESARFELLDQALRAWDAGDVPSDPNRPGKKPSGVPEFDPVKTVREMISDERESKRVETQRALAQEVDQLEADLRGLPGRAELSDGERRKERTRIERRIKELRERLP